ncbi:hypothetical protein [Candidatus Profftia lariciata]|uniref:hypothetical protein n=1 Tax=Candidatus Profftia lariciata TaxID=1987921 RepID=UPI001D007D78|nr:hypothetical protein [Candidatus Profftia lariciata]
MIILPDLLQQKKNNYNYEFTAIPLAPKIQEISPTNIIPSINQSLSKMPYYSQTYSDNKIQHDNKNVSHQNCNKIYNINKPTQVIQKS